MDKKEKFLKELDKACSSAVRRDKRGEPIGINVEEALQYIFSEFLFAGSRPVEEVPESEQPVKKAKSPKRGKGVVKEVEDDSDFF